MKNVLLTGGLGFIGSHICVELLNSGHTVIIVDNLSNSSIKVLDNIEKICNKKPIFYQLDVKDPDLDVIFMDHKINYVIHLAGLKSVTQSIKNPLKYYDININTTLNLIKCMQNNNCYNLIFSSSATVYGNQNEIDKAITEKESIGHFITSPYGETKYIIEMMLMSLCRSSNKWRIITLRYFNPVGAHQSGLIGESPKDKPNNLMPYIMRVAYKNNIDCNFDNEYDELKIFGDTYETDDGTCVRDFIHVSDLAKAHLLSINYMPKIKDNEYKCFNIGLGKGISVLQLVNTFSAINKVKLPYKIVDKRQGDIAILYCDNSLAINELEWMPIKDINDMCKDSWKFQLNL